MIVHRKGKRYADIARKISQLKTVQDIPTLLESTIKKETIEQPATTDSLPICIWKILFDGKERTVAEIQKLIKNPDFEENDIETVINQFHTVGILLSKKIPTSNGLKIVFQLKKGATMTTYTNAEMTNRFNLRQPDIFVHDKNGIIDPQDGVDVCIWKVMADRKFRDVHEIAQILGAYKFDYTAVKNRVVSLMKKDWFDRNENSNHTQYALKKQIKMPESLKRVIPSENEKTFKPTTVLGEKLKTAIETITPIKTISTIPSVKKIVEMQKEHANPTIPVILPEDKYAVKIWKIMADGKPYTAEELTILLAETGMNPKSVTPRISTLNFHGWFDITKVEGKKRPINAYILKPTIPMPSNKDVFKEATRCFKNKNNPKIEIENQGEKQTISSVQETDDTQSVNQEVIKDTKGGYKYGAQLNVAFMTTPGVAEDGVEVCEDVLPRLAYKTYETRVVETAVEEPLIESTIKIRGIPFTLLEAEALKKSLILLGYRSPNNSLKCIFQSNTDSILKGNFTIKGKAFEYEDLEKITQHLINTLGTHLSDD